MLVLAAGIILFIGAEQALVATNNPNFFPTVILLGAFAIPVAFVTYFYEHVKHRDISMPLLTVAFVVGGAIGLIMAGLLEYYVARGVDIFNDFKVGLIEESVKLVFPFILFITGRYRHEADGLIFGIAVGMGFAAFETMGYGLIAYIQSQGNIDALWQIFLIRGFISPAGHAAWTGFLCAVIWRQWEQKTHSTFNLATNGAFIIVIVLHSVWNIVNSINPQNNLQVVAIILGNIAIAALSLTLLILRYREAKKLLVKENVQ